MIAAALALWTAAAAAEPVGPVVAQAPVHRAWRGLLPLVVVDDATPPSRIGRAAPGAPTDHGLAPRVLGPDWFAAASGSGLRGATVTSIAATARGPWVGTDGGGVAWWNGSAWRHLGVVHGLPSARVWAVAVDGAVRWFASDAGILRLDGVGVRTTVDLIADDLLADADGAWVLAEGAVRRVDADGVVGPVIRDGCSALLDLGGTPVASCPDILAIPSGAPVPGLGAIPVAPRALVPRRGGAWAATAWGLLASVDDAPVDAPAGLPAPILDALRVGEGLMVAAGDGGLWSIPPGDTPRAVRAPDGLPGTRVDRLAAGPTPWTAWAGTDRGVALVDARGDATPLPLAPLAAGRGVRDVVAARRSLAVATDDGLAWIGPRPPRGWGALAAAAGDDATALALTTSGWFALLPDAVLYLGPRGTLARLRTDAPTRSLHAVGLATVVVTDAGVRAWWPGATMLSSRDPVDGALALVDGTGWARTADGLVPIDGRSAALPWADLRDAVTHPEGVALCDAAGVVVVAPTHPDRARPVAGPTSCVAVRLGPTGLVALDADGQVWIDEGDGTMTPGPARVRGPRGLRADADGVWILAADGLTRLRLAHGPRAATPRTARPLGPRRR